MKHRITIDFIPTEDEEEARDSISLEFDHLIAKMFNSYDIITKGSEIDAKPNGIQKLLIEAGNGVEPKDFTLIRYLGVQDEGDQTHMFSINEINNRLLNQPHAPPAQQVIGNNDGEILVDNGKPADA